MPPLFLAWAKRNEIDVPALLVEEVEKRGGKVAVWKSLYEDVVEARKRDAEIAEAQSAERIERLNELSARLKSEHARMGRYFE